MRRVEWRITDCPNGGLTYPVCGAAKRTRSDGNESTIRSHAMSILDRHPAPWSDNGDAIVDAAGKNVS